MNSFRLLVCAVLFCASALASAAEFCELPPCDDIPAGTFYGKVIAVIDGDTLLVIRAGRPAKVRLAGIDAPEKTQPYGAESRKSLAALLMGKQVRVVGSAADDYGRLIATLYDGEISANREQVRRGMAWEYSRFRNRDLLAAQREAQQTRRGLWAEEGPIEPSQWRKQHPPVSASSSPAYPEPAIPPASGHACGKRHCQEIGSCEEARRYFSLCGQQALDGDADGKPCESLCAPEHGKPGKVW